MDRRLFMLAALVLVLVGCGTGSNEAIRDDGRPRSEQEVDIQEAVYRYQFEHNASSATAMGEVDVYFLRGPDGADPSPDLLERFSGHVPLVAPASERASSDEVTHEESGGQGIELRIDEIRWLDDGRAEVDGGYWEGNLSASGSTYEVEKVDGGWTVVQESFFWIS